jgi:hypothetical protein
MILQNSGNYLPNGAAFWKTRIFDDATVETSKLAPETKLPDTPNNKDIPQRTLQANCLQ